MSMYNLIEYRGNYSKTSGSLLQYYRHQLHATLTGSESFKSKIEITRNTHADRNTKEVEISMPLKHLRNF